MSLDCYPFGERHTIDLGEQPIAVDVAYDDNLLISVVDDCKRVVVYNLEQREGQQQSLLGNFRLGKDIVIDQIVYCKQGDYIACRGHRDGSVSVFTVFNWRLAEEQDEEKAAWSCAQVEQLDLVGSAVALDEVDRRDNLECIDVCQRTGNLAASYGDLIVIYRHNQQPQPTSCPSDHSHNQSTASDEDLSHGFDIITEPGGSSRRFTHIINLKLAMWASKVSLAENYLALMASDHVQVLKLELLTLQIQLEALSELELGAQPAGAQAGGQANRSSSGSSGDGQSPGVSATAAVAARLRRSASSTAIGGGDGGQSVGVKPTGGSATTASTSADTASMVSESNNSSATNFSTFNSNATSEPTPTRLAASEAAQLEPGGQSASEQLNNDSDMSIITMNNKRNTGPQHEAESVAPVDNCQDDCTISWNLNTKKLVKLPTLMHNTSSDLASFHICHPLELLGPASESIACRVLTRLYSSHFSQNQLEPVVLLCKQFDSEREPVKSAHLQPVYLASADDHKRLQRTPAGSGAADCTNEPAASSGPAANGGQLLLKSAQHELLASMTYFVATLTNCFVYSLHGKKVARIQTITHPDLCVDLRADLLNVYLLTPLGLQITTTGLCDATFRYDWSSSADLNLSFVACNRARVLTTSGYILMISAASASHGCTVEFWPKPGLAELFKQIVRVNNRCQSVSVRSNLLTYLHANAQLALMSEPTRRQQPDEALERLKTITVMLCKQLLQKKQTNVITNTRIDKAIKHLLDISYCDLSELMRRHIELLEQADSPASLRKANYTSMEQSSELDDDDERPMDCDYELLVIYLKHSKFNASILEHLRANAANELVSSRTISYMFDTNPRLLIKCAQRFAKEAPGGQAHEFCTGLLVGHLRQLAELDSTGINRATVLFTLANLLAERQGPLAIQSLGQIKPINHLAITMCSNYETIGAPLARLVAANYAQVYKLFLGQLERRDPEAARQFAAWCQQSEVSSGQPPDGEPAAGCQRLKNFGAKLRQPDDQSDQNKFSAEEEENEDVEESFEQKLHILAQLEPAKLAEVFLNLRQQQQGAADSVDDDTAVASFLRASIKLLESQLILARLCESSR